MYLKFYNLKNIYYIYKITVMNKEKISKSLYPSKQMPYNLWCKKFKVGSRVDKSKLTNFYEDGQYDYDKFIKMINSYGENKTEQSVWKQISEAFLALCKRQVQKAWNRLSIA